MKLAVFGSVVLCLFFSVPLFAAVTFYASSWDKGAQTTDVFLDTAGGDPYEKLDTGSGGIDHTDLADHYGYVLNKGNAMCSEIAESITIPDTHTYDPGFVGLTAAPINNTGQGSPEMSASAAESMRRLWARHFDEVDTAVERGAFQLVLWDLSYDGGNGFDLGLLTASTKDGQSEAELDLANNWLADAIDDAYTGDLANLLALSDSSQQDLIVEIDGPAGDIVPEPTAIVIWSLLGGLGLALGSWRRRAA